MTKSKSESPSYSPYPLSSTEKTRLMNMCKVEYHAQNTCIPNRSESADPMASCLFQYAIVTLTVCCVAAQSGFYSPYRVNVAHNYPVGFIQQPYVLSQSYPANRRSGECSQYPGSSCMFVLLCLMGGGVSAGSCSKGLLSTCCVPPSSLVRPTTPRPLTTRGPVRVATLAQIEDTTRQVNTTDALTTKPKSRSNITYCGIAKAKPQSRIIGGNDAMYGEFPWQAHIKLNKQQCSGVLLNNRYVLTAAHCIYQVRLSDISIQLGVYDIQDQSRQDIAPQTFSVIEKKVHPSFTYKAAHPDRYDVAVLKLDRKAKFHDTVVPICLPKKDWDFEGWKGIITGWGKTDTGLANRFGTRLLQKVDVPIISNEKCEDWHQDKGIDITISNEMMCAGYEEGKKDACVGDSGGPLMVMVHGRWVVVGLVSAGFGCAQAKQPGIYHRVPSTVDWLRESIAS
ncbi:plasma kallikrein [Trichonephila inaurata madagascariensis]|uniref:Plasma kallikrein n=1 Tax=Trichonephila inaurata madagascariensis TaxID=2747483 RepID=A0A8X6MK94_9ARAC|nr:plasma kallikrein [Trichonephila inaurata madagascariensis]